MSTGFARIAAVSLHVHLGDVAANEREIASAMERLEKKGVAVAVFPELCLTGYTLGDLLLHDLVQRQALAALKRLAAQAGDMAAVVGLPFSADGRLFNCAAVLQKGRIRGIVPKTFLPNGNEFYETRWFVSGTQAGGSVAIDGRDVPFRPELLFDRGDFRFAVEICEDLWTPAPPSNHYAVMGADVIVNPSASNALAGKHEYRRALLSQQSARLYAGYAYAGAGFGESTSDLAFCGYTGVYENGRALQEGPRFQMDGGEAVADVDIQRLRFQRQRNGSFYQDPEATRIPMTLVELAATPDTPDAPTTLDKSATPATFATPAPLAGLATTPATSATPETSATPTPLAGLVGTHATPDVPDAPDAPAAPAAPLLRPIDPLPFVPTGPGAEERLEEIVQIQLAGLCTRLSAIRCQNLVIGVSGGLDSTLALLIAACAFQRLGLPPSGIHAVTLPGMGTGARTKTNADRLMEALQVSASEINIGPAVRQHFQDIGQDENVHDVTYENSQARERTQILMDLANKVNGIVLGTGDMSELALGFCTYNGDHMSMYNPNCSVPKTLVKSLVRYLSESRFEGAALAVCADILDTPISPELLPVTEGELNQRTEDILGDYALHDFFLYHLLDSGSSPEKLLLLAGQAFLGVYPEEKIRQQLKTFLRRFFTQQFKRNCVPDGPKVGSISLSPRGDLRMPSDMSYRMWLEG